MNFNEMPIGIIEEFKILNVLIFSNGTNIVQKNEIHNFKL